MFTCQPAYSIAQSKRSPLFASADTEPGPSSYSVQPSWTVGVARLTSKRPSLPQPTGPGPAAYTLPQMIGKAPRAFFTTRPQTGSKASLEEEGETCERVIRTELKSPQLRGLQRVSSSRLSSRRHISPYDLGRFHNDGYFFCDTQVPGPAIYSSSDNLVRKSAPRPTIGTARRVTLTVRSVSPGPGFLPRSSMGSTTYSFAKAPRSNSREGSPGPGHYDLPNAFAARPSYFTRNKAKPSYGLLT